MLNTKNFPTSLSKVRRRTLAFVREPTGRRAMGSFGPGPVQAVQDCQVASGLVRDRVGGQHARVRCKPRQERGEPYGESRGIDAASHEIGFAWSREEEVLTAHVPLAGPAGVEHVAEQS